MINIDKALASACKTGKVSYGANTALQNAKTGKAKMIVLASNCPKDIKEQIEYYGEISKVPVVTYKGGSMDLGRSLQQTLHYFGSQYPRNRGLRHSQNNRRTTKRIKKLEEKN